MTQFIHADVDISQPTAAINLDYLADEPPLVRMLAERARLAPALAARVEQRALHLVHSVRETTQHTVGLDSFLRSYSLESQEGVLMLCLAEALLRIPDDATVDRLIADRLARGNWRAHLHDTESLFVNASTWGLILTGRLMSSNDAAPSGDPQQQLGSLIARLGEPVVRAALRQAMRILGRQFILSTELPTALARATEQRGPLTRYSFDVLGEAAMTAADARRHFEAYRAAIEQVGRTADRTRPLLERDGVSIKLSALHPRYEFAQRQRVLAELGPRLAALQAQAQSAGVGLTIDAEECERLELSLLLFEQLLASPATREPGQLGLAVQAYQKRAYRTIEWLIARLRARGECITVRLVKGAYWDSEIKRAQQAGLANYPVYTRKSHTDAAYLACACLLATAGDVIEPQFATHNAHTVAYVAELYESLRLRFEYQRLHGMGEALYAAVMRGEGGQAHPCRIYAPVGPQSELLPYLVRRLLENGANVSFVHRAADRHLPPIEVVRDPLLELTGAAARIEEGIPPPSQLYGSARRNSLGLNLHDGRVLEALMRDCQTASDSDWLARPIIDGRPRSGATRPLVNPAHRSEIIGEYVTASRSDVQTAAAVAADAWVPWDEAGGAHRATVLERAAQLFEAQRAALVARCVREAGKTLPDSLAEVREAVDFLRYYAMLAREQFGAGQALPGPVGEINTLRSRGRGVFGCVSPWNFPLAIFTGQIAAALAAGNAVLAKPAEQTPLTAALAVELLHRAGVPGGVLHFLPGDGAEVGATISSLSDLAGVAFTGSIDTARQIARSLAMRRGAIATLIAETGGQNALIADSSALIEQVVQDLLSSAYNSAGQRCSAVRVLYVQEQLAPRLLEVLCGAMDELVIDDPALLATDIGPVIDAEAHAALEAHVARLAAAERIVHRAPLGMGTGDGWFFAPLLAKIGSIRELTAEVFGPVLHVVFFRSEDLDQVVDDINSIGYGLTLGIHSRIESRVLQIAQRARVGNIYVNRNTIGAVVGVQPFGGCGLSGTGPKAGGPHTLRRFATEQTVSINAAAVGGNAALLARR